MVKELSEGHRNIKKKGKDFVIVSSGAIALGQNYTKIKKKGSKLK